jgi:hypothetical protein
MSRTFLHRCDEAPSAPRRQPAEDRLPARGTSESEDDARGPRLRVLRGSPLRRGIAMSMRKVEAAMARHFPELLAPLKLLLALIAVRFLADVRRPILLFFVGPPGSGKTLVLDLVAPLGTKDDPLAAHDPLADLVYRCDKLTPKSFVSHRADLSEQQLAKKVDLLPRIADRTMVTKEMAPFFHGDPAALMESFSLLALLADGSGLVTDSGAHGRRGYGRGVRFQWTGATTPLKRGALKIMQTIGARALFAAVVRRHKTDREVAWDLEQRRSTSVDPRDTCRTAVQNFLLQLRSAYDAPAAGSDGAEAAGPSVPLRRADVVFPYRALRQVARWAQALARLRSSTQTDEADREHVERVADLLETLATAHAVIHGRTVVTDADLAQVAHVACSSGSGHCGQVLYALVASGGEATSTALREATQLSTPTVLTCMGDLADLGFVTLTEGHGPHPARITLSDEFARLRLA